MTRPTAETPATARIAQLASGYDLPAEPLVAAVQALGPAAAEQCLVGVDHSLAWLGVHWVLPRTEPRAPVMATLAQTHPARHAARERLMARGAEAQAIELHLARDGSVSATLVSIGPGDPDTDLQLAAELAALAPDSVVLLGALVAELVRAGATISALTDSQAGRTRLRLSLPSDAAGQRATAIAALVAVATGLQVTAAQRELIKHSHPTLAQQRPVTVSFVMENQMVTTALEVEYAPVSWQSSLQLFAALYPQRDAAEKLGLISTACGAAHVARLRFTLGPDEPPGLEAWASAYTSEG